MAEVDIGDPSVRARPGGRLDAGNLTRERIVPLLDASITEQLLPVVRIRLLWITLT